MTNPEPTGRSASPWLLAWLELVRLPNLFTAMADVAMGFLFVRAVAGPADYWPLGLLVVASTLLYAGGVVLNDVFDLPVDARQRPERPLPSGRVSPRVARALGFELLVLGAAVAWTAAWLTGLLRPGIVACLLALLVVGYDAVLKRTPLGPLAMGGCRTLNVLLGMSVAGRSPGAAEWLVAAGIGVYITGVTWFARTEARQSDHRQLSLATMVMVGGIGLLAWFPHWIASERLVRLLQWQPQRWYLFMTLLGVWVGWRGLRAVLHPSPLRVQLVVKQCILTLVILDAAACYAVRGLPGAVAILLLLVPTALLGRWVYST